MTGISMSRVPGGAPLPPCRPLARLPAPATAACLAETGRLCWRRLCRSPAAAAADVVAAGWPKADLEAEAAAIGREGLRVVAEAGIDRTVDRANNGLPRNLRDHRRHGDLHLAQLDAVGRDIDGLQSMPPRCWRHCWCRRYIAP